MKNYIKAIFPAEFSHNRAFWRALILGLVMLVLAVLQLFQFEDFPGVLAAMQLPGGEITAEILAVLLPFLEIASLPYLFSLKLPTKARKASMIAGVAVGVLWIAITVWTSVKMGISVESGIFGAALATSSGWWSVVFAVLLLWSVVLTIRELPKRRDS